MNKTLIDSEEYQRLKRSEDFFREVCEIFGIKYDVVMEYLDIQSNSSKILSEMDADSKKMMFDIFYDIQNQRDNETLLKQYLMDMYMYIGKIRDKAQMAENISKECTDKLKFFL